MSSNSRPLPAVAVNACATSAGDGTVPIGNSSADEASPQATNSARPIVSGRPQRGSAVRAARRASNNEGETGCMVASAKLQCRCVEFFGDGNRHRAMPVPLHARDAVATDRDELLAAGRDPHVVEPQVEPVVERLDERHLDDDLVERDQLGQELALARHGDQRELAVELSQHAGRVVAQEVLAARALPREVVGEVDVADDVGVLERHDVTVVVGARHDAASTPTSRDAGAVATATAIQPCSTTSHTTVVISMVPARNDAARPDADTMRSGGAGWPSLAVHSSAVHTRVAA